jgi:hypothetical protein
MDVLRPFSPSQLAADYIEENNLSDRVIIGSQERIVSPIAGLLDRPIYFPELKRLGTFIPWNETTSVKIDEVLAQTHQLLETEPSPALLILSEPLTQSRPDLMITPLVTFPEEIAPYEDYHLYNVERR